MSFPIGQDISALVPDLNFSSVLQKVISVLQLTVIIRIIFHLEKTKLFTEKFNHFT